MERPREVREFSGVAAVMVVVVVEGGVKTGREVVKG